MGRWCLTAEYVFHMNRNSYELWKHRTFLTLILWGESTARENQYSIGFACQCRGCFRLLDMNPIQRILNAFVHINGSA